MWGSNRRDRQIGIGRSGDMGVSPPHLLLIRLTLFSTMHTNSSPSKPTTWFCLILMDSVLHSIALPAVNRACTCSHVYQIHQTPPAAFVGFSTPQYSPANRACSHVYQIHQTPPAAFIGFSTPQYSPANRACSHVYQIHQTPPAAFVGFRTVYSQAMDALHLLLYQFHQSPTTRVPFYCMLMDLGGFWNGS